MQLHLKSKPDLDSPLASWLATPLTNSGVETGQGPTVVWRSRVWQTIHLFWGSKLNQSCRASMPGCQLQLHPWEQQHLNQALISQHITTTNARKKGQRTCLPSASPLEPGTLQHCQFCCAKARSKFEASFESCLELQIQPFHNRFFHVIIWSHPTETTKKQKLLFQVPGAYIPMFFAQQYYSTWMVMISFFDTKPML